MKVPRVLGLPGPVAGILGPDASVAVSVIVSLCLRKGFENIPNFKK